MLSGVKRSSGRGKRTSPASSWKTAASAGVPQGGDERVGRGVAEPAAARLAPEQVLLDRGRGCCVHGKSLPLVRDRRHAVRRRLLNLQRAHDENPIFHDVPTISLADGLRAVRLKLWDEERRRLVTWAEAGRRP